MTPCRQGPGASGAASSRHVRNGRIFASVAGPMPGTRSTASTVANGPSASRSAIHRSANFGPMPGSKHNCGNVAAFTSSTNLADSGSAASINVRPPPRPPVARHHTLATARITSTQAVSARWSPGPSHACRHPPFVGSSISPKAYATALPPHAAHARLPGVLGTSGPIDDSIAGRRRFARGGSADDRGSLVLPLTNADNGAL